MEVPPALRDVTNQSSLNEMASANTANACGTPTGLSEGSATDEHLRQIAQQCEFYFSDANILKDQFLLKKVKASKEGWVPLAVIEGFKKVQNLSSDHNVVVQALKLSKKLEVSDDGLNVRRRDPLPQWDPSIYYRTLVISKLPNKDDVHWERLTQFFAAEGFPPVLARSFAPGRKIPSDLKRSQELHPLLATEPSAVVEFGDREQASKALLAISKKFPNAYIHFLSDGAKKKSDENSKKKKKKDKKPPTALKQPSSGPPAFLLNLRQPTQTSQVIHIREPIGPPAENSLGFSSGWRELIRFERMCCTASTLSAAQDPSICSAQPVVGYFPHLAAGTEHPVVPNDSAIVSIIPAFPSSPPTE